MKQDIKVTHEAVHFATWLQDNFSQDKNMSRTCKCMLPTGFMREAFTDKVYPITELYKRYCEMFHKFSMKSK